MPGVCRECGGGAETPKCERATKWLEYLEYAGRERERVRRAAERRTGGKRERDATTPLYCEMKFSLVSSYLGYSPVHSLLRCSGVGELLHVWWPDVNSLFTGGGWKPEDEDCSRVFTTSRGQVTIAPAVPATLRETRERERGGLC